MRVPGKRFFQYEYRLRLINEGAFGADVDVPQLQISYRIESTGHARRSGTGPRSQLQPAADLDPPDVDRPGRHDGHPRGAGGGVPGGRGARVARRPAPPIGTILFGLAGVVLLVMLISLFRQRRVRTHRRELARRRRGRSRPAAAQRAVGEVRPAEPRRLGRGVSRAGRWRRRALPPPMVSGRAIAQTRASGRPRAGRRAADDERLAGPAASWSPGR